MPWTMVMNYLDLGDVDGAHPAVVEDGHVPPPRRRLMFLRRRRSAATVPRPQA